MPRTAICISTVVASSLAFTSLALADTHVVAVGSGTFTPDNVNCEPGDVIRWERAGGNHTVTSGSSCTANDVYFHAPINSSNTSFEWTVPATVTGEIPYFCDPHCSSGMIGMLTVAPPAEDSGFRVALVDVAADSASFAATAGGGGIESLMFGFDNSCTGHMMLGLEVENVSGVLSLEVGTGGAVQVRSIGGAFDMTFPTGSYNVVLTSGPHAIIRTSAAESVAASWNEAEYGDSKEPFVEMGSFSVTGGVALTYRMSHDIGWIWLTTSSESGAGNMVLTAHDGDAEKTITWIGNVTDDGTFAMPDEATDSTATMFTEGDHTITLGSASALGIKMEDGDDDGGGGGGCLGDLNGDEIIDGADLTMLLGSWGPCP